MGLVIAALSEKTQMRQDDDEKEIEALAVPRAEIFARELGLTDIFFGRDSKIVLTEEETLLRERSVNHVRQQDNQITHLLSKPAQHIEHMAVYGSKNVQTSLLNKCMMIYFATKNENPTLFLQI